MTVMKFGGTSLGTAERIRGVVELVAQRAAEHGTVVVVSAMAGATNDLITAAQLGTKADAEAGALVTALCERHRQALAALAPKAELPNLGRTLDSWCSDLASLVHGISLVRDCSPRVLDAVAAYGELFSATLVAAALRARGIPAAALDAREVIRTDDTFGRAVVDRKQSYERVRARLAPESVTAVVTGFIAASEDGSTTTLGRGGSDYTATLVGAAIGASAIEIWTDVDGVMSAVPRLVPQAFSLERMTYTELMELSHFGAKVVYPPSVTPASEAGIPLAIRNTLNPEFPGTWVLPDEHDAGADAQPVNAVRGISSINSVALCRLEGAGMVGMPGIAGRLFGALAREGISVILISQASSEHSICFALEPGAVALARRRIDAEFEVERRAGVVDPVVIEEGFSVIAAVGEGMRHTPGISGRLFDVLGRNGINVRAIAQGSSELNISLVAARSDEERALRLIHDAFFLPRVRTVHVYVAGTGRVGSALLDQLAAESPQLGSRLGVRLIIAGIARSNVALVLPEGIALDQWREHLGRASTETALMVDSVLQSPNAHRVFVDCTANTEVANSYERLLRNGVAIVSANKIALSGSMQRYGELRAAARMGNGLYAETTVGAGLPVLRPIADLVATGDHVNRIEGVLSGTLSFLFAQVMSGTPFSDAVRCAHRLGFTEPDPRDDLSGRDVARKLLILGREAGFEIEPHQVDVKPVLDGEQWATMSEAEFWAALPSVDAHFEQLRQQAIASDAVLCYLGAIDTAGAAVALRTIDRAHPCAALSAGDNLIAVTSSRYAERPLIIRGPGAGPDVTAAGVFADILRAAVESR
ncbi:MAG: bifunctional aspartate kinase/homoserine dehydrogenase I [Gemmatimonadota bacterium]